MVPVTVADQRLVGVRILKPRAVAPVFVFALFPKAARATVGDALHDVRPPDPVEVKRVVAPVVDEAQQQLKSTWNTSVASAELLADAARMEAEAWALQEHDKATLTKEQLLWARRVDRQVVQSENHRLAEKVVNLTDALLRERSEAQAELERLLERLAV